MKTETIIIRTLTFTPVAIVILVFCIRFFIRAMINFCRFGGETIIYPKDRKCIADVYNLIEEKLK